MLTLHLEAATTEEFIQKIKEAYTGLCLPKEVMVEKIPEGVGRYTGRNAQSYGDRLMEYIKMTTEVGGHFSSTSARLHLDLKQSNMQSALGALSKAGKISMKNKGIWKRIV